MNDQVSPAAKTAGKRTVSLERHARARTTALVAALAAVLTTGAAVASEPRPPCGSEPFPGYAAVGPVPELAMWKPGELDSSWVPPSCLGWEPRDGARVVAIAGRFKADDVDVVLERIGRISRQKSLVYWSAQRREWKRMLDDAFALGGPTLDAKRADFRPSELEQGARVYLAYDDSERIGPVVYETSVVERSEKRIVLRSRNDTAGRFMGLSVAGRGDLEMTLFLDQEQPGVWRYYGLARSQLRVPSMFALAEEDYLNRAVAMFRSVAGYRSDVAPAVGD